MEKQTQQLVGLGESKIVIDYIEIPSSDPDRAAYWISYCQESEIQKIIDQYGLSRVAICDVIGGVDALAASMLPPTGRQDEWMLLDVRDGGTLTTVFKDRYPRYSYFFPVGNDMAQEKGAQTGGAIRVGILNGGRDWELQRIRKGIPMVAQEWARDVQRAWQEYRVSLLKDNHSDPLHCPVMLMADHQIRDQWKVAAKDSLAASLLGTDVVWPNKIPNLVPNERRHWGAVLAAKRKQVKVPSLLPESVQVAWNDKQINMILRSMALLSCVFAMVVMLVAVIQKAMLWKMKNALIEEVHGVEHRFDQSLLVLQGLKREFKMLQPLIQAERNTLAVVDVLGALQQIRTNHNGWMVLLADKDSYYAGDSTMKTNATTASNIESNSLTNRVNLRRGFIFELVLNSEGEAMRAELADLISFLRNRDFLYNADILPSDTRRPLVASNLVVQGKHFAVSLEMDADVTGELEDRSNQTMVDSVDKRPVWWHLQPNVQSPSLNQEGAP